MHQKKFNLFRNLYLLRLGSGWSDEVIKVAHDHDHDHDLGKRVLITTFQRHYLYSCNG